MGTETKAKETINITDRIFRPCDKKATLYVMQQFDQQSLNATEYVVKSTSNETFA